jgi:multicomponent K+:H+ antiporter subunit D
MNLLLLLPLAVPLALGAGLLAAPGLSLERQRRLGLTGAGVLLGSALWLLALTANGAIVATLVGDWPAPYGIVLVADRLSALMLILTGLLAVGAIAHQYRAPASADRSGRHFHALFQLQLFGLAGAFLTGDLFNLFVFFEVLLMASYGLLVQGGGAARSRAALHYVVLNMIGSTLFLMGVALIYATAGTLNLADLHGRLPSLQPHQASLAGAGLMLLIGAFALKTALVPLHAWLVPAYRAAVAPVAALFAIMTKVGVYALLRLWMLVPAAEGAASAPLAALPIMSVVSIGALLTLVVGAAGVVSATDMRAMTANLVLVSVGTLVVGIAAGTPQGIAAGLYYLIHTTLVTGGLFLLADHIGLRREQGTRLKPGARPPATGWIAALFLGAAIAIAGLPPLSGFVGKALILEAVLQAPADGAEALRPGWMLSWAVLLGASLLVVVGLSRAGIVLFWQGAQASDALAPGPSGMPAASVLLAASPLLVVLAAPVAQFTEATASQLIDGKAYVSAIEALKPVDPPPDAAPSAAISPAGEAP